MYVSGPDRKELAPQVGFEPTTLRLTAELQCEGVRSCNGDLRRMYELRAGVAHPIAPLPIEVVTTE
jgi:hypothetical protein